MAVRFELALTIRPGGVNCRLTWFFCTALIKVIRSSGSYPAKPLSHYSTSHYTAVPQYPHQISSSPGLQIKGVTLFYHVVK